MSIYGTTVTLSAEYDDDDPPIIYQGSHVLPSDDDPRGGVLMFAQIPGWIERDGRDKPDDESQPHPWLRLDLIESPKTDGGSDPGHATVVLDRKQAEQVRDYLADWLSSIDEPERIDW